VAVIADLEGFTNYHNDAGSLSTLPHYLSYVFRALTVMFNGGELFWIEGNTPPITPLEVCPKHVKYLGDGALYLFRCTSFSDDFPSRLMDRLYYLSRNFELLNNWMSKKHGHSKKYPSHIRFGVARGHTYKLARKNPKMDEYHGVPINLASRLQSFCSRLGVIAASNIGNIDSNDQFRLSEAKNVRSFGNEYVYVPSDELDALDTSIRTTKFTDFVLKN